MRLKVVFDGGFLGLSVRSGGEILIELFAHIELVLQKN